VGPWHKSSYSGANGNCVELAAAAGGRALRDSKAAPGPVLTFGTAEWSAFLADVKSGRRLG
jgi:hypothetical protein